ncbi:MAG: inositol monophosphatase family protein [Promethearchaeota archaeon]
MEVSIDLLKQMALEIYDAVHPLLGTELANQKIKKGAGGDISMHIDIVAEKVVIDILEKSRIDILLISEEIGEKFIGDKEKAIQNKFKLIVDPIDGSNNAVRGIPFCSVSIAFAIGDNITSIEKGVVLDLISKDLYWAEKGKGAFKNGEHISVSTKTIRDSCIFEVDFRLNELMNALIKYKDIIKKIYRVRVMGSCALSLCQVAKGSMDAYINFKKSMRLVDLAAGLLILKEAGGKIFTFEGKDLDKELSIDLRFAFIASNAHLDSFFKNELIKLNS